MFIYRIRYSIPITTSTFFEEFTGYLESVIMSSELLLITGDFNIHVDDPLDTDCAFIGVAGVHGLCSSMLMYQLTSHKPNNYEMWGQSIVDQPHCRLCIL